MPTIRAHSFERCSAGLERIAIVDIDAHHGNGLQEAFYDSPQMLTISLRQQQSFAPQTGDVDARGTGAGVGYNVKVPPPPGSGRGAYLTRWSASSTRPLLVRPGPLSRGRRS